MPCLLVALTLSAPPVRAGVIANLLKTTGVDGLLQSLSQATGIALDEQLVSLDSLLSSSASPIALPQLVLSQAQSRQLALMDLSEDEFRRLQAFADAAPVALAVSFGGNDQPALVPAEPLDPHYRGGQVQADRRQCADSDSDGVCDEDDQCLKTPPGAWVMSNGCHIEAAVRLRFDPVGFMPASAQLSEAAERELASVAAAMKQHPDYRLAVVGYTDAQGDSGKNRQLSLARARAARDFLVASGLAPGRLRVAGLGETRPRADNTNEVGRAKNRRVELIVIESAKPGH